MLYANLPISCSGNSGGASSHLSSSHYFTCGTEFCLMECQWKQCKPLSGLVLKIVLPLYNALPLTKKP